MANLISYILSCLDYHFCQWSTQNQNVNAYVLTGYETLTPNMNNIPQHISHDYTLSLDRFCQKCGTWNACIL